MMRWVYGLLLITLLVGWFVWLNDESLDLEVTRHRFGKTGDAAVIWRIAQVSDLHVRGGAEIEERVIGLINQEQPDLVVLTGDQLSHRDKLPELGAFLDKLDNRSKKIVILGNWEYWTGLDKVALRKFYAQHGVTLLVNGARVVEKEGQSLLVVGLDDARLGHPNWERALADHSSWPGPMLILAHNPDTMAMVPAKEKVGADRVMLSGHTHGGQIVLFPFLNRNHPCLAGWCRNQGMPMYVSRGVGMSVIPLRFGARPELPLFEWRL
ncbi:MAG: metallophosphoesterase [Magnetococcales bacterium]|nr:metallophosphoesterase [Magnetococcales bacterium]MBF0263344.1 metallophosphoesterase [Magnetococcales bacterium]